MKWETFFAFPVGEGGSRRLTDEASPSIDSKSVKSGEAQDTQREPFHPLSRGKETGFFTVTPHQSRPRRDSFPTGEA